MDRRVKERLVGASILVILFILVVPELLSGPKPAATASAGVKLPASMPREATRTVTVDLNTNKTAVDSDAATPGQTAASAAAPRNEVEPPEPFAVAAAPSPPATSPAPANPPVVAHNDPERPASLPPLPAATKPATKPAAVKPPALQPKATPDVRGTWAVQAGTFHSRGNADALVRQLKTQGFAAAVFENTAGKTVYYRVRSGALTDRASADRLAGKLKAAGHSVSVVTLAH